MDAGIVTSVPRTCDRIFYLLNQLGQSTWIQYHILGSKEVLVINTEVPEKLKPYLFHGIDLDYTVNGKGANGTCPFCSKEKFGVRISDGVFHCFSCDRKGHSDHFIQQLWETLDKTTRDYTSISRDRGLLYQETPMHWGLAWSPFKRQWIVPGHNLDGTIGQLYRYTKLKNGRHALLCTSVGISKIQHRLFGIPLLPADSDTVYLCEGIWDAMALWEVLNRCKLIEDGLRSTANQSQSLGSTIGVLAVPGCGTFFPSWAKLFEGKNVVILYDNDYHNEKTGKSAGYSGVLRVASILSQSSTPPESIRYVRWGGSSGPVDHNPDLANGWDVRDALGTGDLNTRIKSLEGLLELISDLPDEELTSATYSSPSDQIACQPCDRYKHLVTSWRRALKWTDGLDHALSVMLASIASTRSVGDQLWVKIIGPPACGKSTLCEAVSVNREYILAKSTIRGFHSGFRLDGEDCSLVSQLSGKTLVTKDGDTLLQSPNLGQILSEARDLYDSTSRTHYRNKMGKDYQGIRMTWILCGTGSLKTIDSSELGERFLDCVIMEQIDDELEDEISWRAANRADRNIGIEANGQLENHYEPDLSNAMSLTGGYVNYLRKNASRQLASITSPEWSLRQCARLGKFVAHMRARPSQRQGETVERELSARLVGQLVRLAKCLALVLNKQQVDREVMQRVTRVAMDTSRGLVLQITACMYDMEDGVDLRTLSLYVNHSYNELKSVLRFLGVIGVVERFESSKTGVGNKVHYQLTSRMKKLYKEVMK